MIIGVLETGPVATALQPAYGRYGRMFETMMRPHFPDAEFAYIAVYDGELPVAPDAATAWIITGSKFGAYETHPWIPPFEEFLRAVYAARIPMAGICFGHQILAQALGGTVVKSEKGWGLGTHRYQITRSPNWMKFTSDIYTSHAIHQDQVTAIPDDATVLATSDFCEYAALAYGDPDAPNAITLQPHPELDAEFVERLIKIRRGNVFDTATADQALSAIGNPVNNDEWAATIAAFFKTQLV